MKLVRRLELALALFGILLVVGCTSAPIVGEVAEMRQIYDGAMRPHIAVNTFAHWDKVFPTRVVSRGSFERPLPKSNKPLPNITFSSGNKTYDLYDYLALNRVAGLLVIKNGEVVVEDYELGIDSSTRWVSFLVAKSFASTLVGAAIMDGFIKSLDDPLTQYLPELRNSAYAGVTVRHLLQMASGVRWDETYTNPTSDRRKLLEEQLAGKPPGYVLRYMSSLPRAGEPGTIWKYSTGETFLVGALVESATKRPLSEYLSQKIWIPWGMGSDATWWVESPNGMVLAGGGLSATMRDFGRFGLLVLNDGVINGKRLVPEGWFSEATSPKVIGGKPVNYGYQWWPLPKGDAIQAGAVAGRGIFGQFLYVNPSEKLVIVVLSARPKPTGSAVITDYDFFGAVAKALH